MNCDQIHEITPLYLTGELQAEQLGEFHAHVAGCKACADEIDSNRQLDDALRAALGEEMPDASEVVARVRRQIDRDEPWRRASHPGWARIGFAFAAALVLTIATFGWVSAYRQQKAVALAAADDHFNDLVLLRHSDWLVKPADMDAFIEQQFPQRAGLLRLLTPDRASLEKVRLCRLRGAAYAHIVFKTGAAETSIFVIDPRRNGAYKAWHLGDGGHDLEVSGFAGPGLNGIVVGERGAVPTNQIARQLAARL